MPATLTLQPRSEPAFAWPEGRPLLAAEWRNLALLNYEVPSAVLQPYVPAGTELDFWEGATYASIVGFQFLESRLRGRRIPFHSAFEEVNLRFYVRRRTDEGWRRGVVFLRELAPRLMVTLVARWLYGENYLCVAMSHDIQHIAGPDGETERQVEYGWRFRGREGRVRIATAESSQRPLPGSPEEFIIEHYWGYSQCRGRTIEYQVAHRPWQIARAAAAEFDGDVAGLYGPSFTPYLRGTPASAFWADGSAVRVYAGNRLGQDA